MWGKNKCVDIQEDFLFNSRSTWSTRCWSAWDRFCFKCWIIKSVSSVVNEIFCRRALVVKVIRNVIISLEDDGFSWFMKFMRKASFSGDMFWKAGFWEKKFKSMKETPLIEKYLKFCSCFNWDKVVLKKIFYLYLPGKYGVWFRKAVEDTGDRSDIKNV